MPVRLIDLGPADGQVAPPDAAAGVRRLIQATCFHGSSRGSSRGSTWNPRVTPQPKPETVLKWIVIAKQICPDDTRTGLQHRLPDLFGEWRADSLLSDWRGWLGCYTRKGPRNPYILAQQLLAALPAHLVQREP